MHAALLIVSGNRALGDALRKRKVKSTKVAARGGGAVSSVHAVVAKSDVCYQKTRDAIRGATKIAYLQECGGGVGSTQNGEVRLARGGSASATAASCMQLA